MKQFVCVEFPGQIISQSAALQTLGGTRAIDEAFEGQEESLALNFTSSHPTAHPLYGQIHPTNNILVKITRRRYITPDTVVAGEWSQDVEVMGVIKRTCVYRGMSDFQYMIPEDPMSKLLGSLHAYDYEALSNFSFERDNFITNPLRCMPPPIFSSIDTPLPYNYTQHAIAPRSTLIRHKHVKFDTVTEFTTVPHCPTPEIRLDFKSKSDMFGDVIQRCMDRLQLLFEEHPIWSRIALIHFLEKGEMRFLPSYLVGRGPFIGCWVKYGVNPSSDCKYRIYQQMVTSDKMKRVQTSEQAKEAAGAQGGTPPYIFDGTANKASKKYQVLHFTDPESLKHLDNPKNWLTQYDPKFGYYREDAMEHIRKIMRRKLFGRTDAYNDFIDDSEHHEPLDDDEQRVLRDFQNEGGTRIQLTQHSTRSSPPPNIEEYEEEEKEDEEASGSDGVVEKKTVKKKSRSRAEKYAMQFRVEMEESLRVRVDERVDELMKGLKEAGGEDGEDMEEFYHLFGSESD